MTKLHLIKTYKSYYNAGAKPELVTFGEITYNSIFCFIKEHELRANGLHHEIYLSDPRKTPPEKMKTIIRYPVK